MATEYPKRKCSAVGKDGQPCRAWAIHDSEPALCAVHAGRNVGGGAPEGNQNALKHGYYAKAIRSESPAYVEKMKDRSLVGELVTGRFILGELVAYLLSDGQGVEEKLAVVPLINATLRTIVYIVDHVKEDPVDWDEILDALQDDWDIEI